MELSLKKISLTKLTRIGIGALTAIMLAACGGGGGSAGTTIGTGTSTGTTATPNTTTAAAAPTIRIALFNGATATTSISASGVTTAQATVVDDRNQPVRGKLVTFTGDPTLITLNPASGAVLTDSVTGIASIQITPASLTSAGAGVLSVASTVVPTSGSAGVLVTSSLDYQLSAANLTLSTLNVSTSTPLAAYGTRAVSVLANINGLAAINTPVKVTFSADCGTVSPATVSTDGTGKASSTYTANSTTDPGCAGKNVNITAAATGAPSLTGTINVQATQATNIQFVSATPQLIYLVGSVGATQSQVDFKVVDSSGNPLQNQSVNLSLSNTGPGVSLNTVGNTSTVTLTSDSAGLVTVPVFSGTIPTSLQVSAVLASNLAVTTKSNILLVASGRAVQSRASLAVEKLSIEGFNIDGESTNVTFSLADRQGNPVPVGTSVNFVSSHGVMIPATCIVPARPDGTSSSACTSSIRSQGTRPADGRVAILAYTPGEEDFVDFNGNNIYDTGEAFTDVGNAIRDDNFNGAYDAGEFIVPRGNGSTSCTGFNNGRPNTCDGAWGAIDVRAQAMVVFATGNALITPTGTSVTTGVSFTITDLNGNSLPLGTTLAVAGRARAGVATTCTATVTPTTVANRVGLTTATVFVASTCAANDLVDITITSPGGIVTNRTLTLTP